MDTTLLDWLAQIGLRTFQWSLGLLLLINGAAIATYFVTRSRTLVNRWTTRVLAIDLLLIGAGAGVPMVTSLARLTVMALVPTASSARTAIGGADLDKR